MFCYEVKAVVEEGFSEEFEAYMLAKHIAEVLETGCFSRARFGGEKGEYRTAYMATEMAGIDRYLESFTAAMRDDFKLHFPEGIELSRTIYEE